MTTQENLEPSLFEKLATLTDAEYLEHSKIITKLEDTMMQSASFADATSAHVLIALARAFGALWTGLDGNTHNVLAGFTQASIESGFMVLSERLGIRIRSQEQVRDLATSAVKKESAE